MFQGIVKVLRRAARGDAFLAARNIKHLRPVSFANCRPIRACASISKCSFYTHAFVGFLSCRFLRLRAGARLRAPPALDNWLRRQTVEPRGGIMRPTSTSVKLAAVAMTAPSALGLGFSAAAQESRPPFSPQQCREANAVILELLKKYSKVISPALAKSWSDFGDSNCDMNSKFVMEEGRDNAAHGEFRTRMVAIRMRQAALTNN